MRLNNILILSILIFFYCSSLASADGSCLSTPVPSICGAGYRGLKKYCDMSPLDQARVQFKSYGCSGQSWTSYVYLSAGIDEWGDGFYVVDCKGIDCSIPRTLCQKYKDLFQPPPADCNFKRYLETDCKDETTGAVVNSIYTIQASDGRTARYETNSNPPANCVPFESLDDCRDKNPMPAECFVDIPPNELDPSSPKPSSCPEGQTKVCLSPGECTNFICMADEELKPPEDGKKGDECYKTITAEGITLTYDICVGNDPAGPKYPPECFKYTCEKDDKGNTMKDGAGNPLCVTENICRNSNENGGNTGNPGNPGETPGGSPGGEDDKDKEGDKEEDKDKDKETESTGLEYWDKVKDQFSEKPLKAEQSSLYDRIGDSSELNKIKGHQYIRTSGSTCKISFTLFNKPFEISLCTWESKFRLLGSILKSIIGIGGVLLILRGGK